MEQLVHSSRSENLHNLHHLIKMSRLSIAQYQVNFIHKLQCWLQQEAWKVSYFHFVVREFTHRSVFCKNINKFLHVFYPSAVLQAVYKMKLWKLLEYNCKALLLLTSWKTNRPYRIAHSGQIIGKLNDLANVEVEKLHYKWLLPQPE